MRLNTSKQRPFFFLTEGFGNVSFDIANLDQNENDGCVKMISLD